VSLALRPVPEQVIVLTGASSGIGLVTARMAAAQGAKLVLAARNEEALRSLVEEIRAGGGSAVHVVADVGVEDDVKRIAEVALTEYGRFDTWVNNAGVSIFGTIDEVSVRDMRRVHDTVFWGVVYGSLAAIRHYEQRGDGAGALINVGSVFGDRNTPLQSTYGSAKHAVHGWTDALRMEMEAKKAPVSVTLIHPGRIDTPYNEHAQSYIKDQPAHRGMIYPPEAVARAILYAAHAPVRDVYVGFQAKAVALAGALMPRSLDKVMERYMFWSQRVDRPSLPREESALHHAGYGLHERGTHSGWHRSGSFYARATEHPGLRRVAAWVALPAAVLAARRFLDASGTRGS
jgi:short-subunit dehydrogenase